MRLTQEQKWKRVVEWLHLQFPARGSVKVRRCLLKDLCGNCELSEDHFLIRINKNQPYRVKLDTLFHEWAHALSWFGPPGVDDHDSEWGLAFARIYGAFVRWNYGSGEK